MKIKNLFYLLLALPLVFAACDTTEEPTPDPIKKEPVLTLTSDNTVYIPSEGGSGEITYTLENSVEGVTLSATTEADWITDITIGETITFNVSANEENAGRRSDIVVAYGDKNFSVSVQQLGAEIKDPVLTLTSESEMTFEGLGGEGEITYTLENPVAAYSLDVTAEEWITVISTDNGVIAFTVATNDETPRSGFITAVYGDLSFKVTINQEANLSPTVLVENTTARFSSDACRDAAISFTLRNADASLNVEATTDAEWISNIAVGENQVTFDIAANDDMSRTADMVLTYGDSSATVTIVQEGLNELAYEIISVSASTRAADEWKLVFTEHDMIEGDMTTRLIVKLPENNAMYIPDGQYSVANGGILVNTFTNNENSMYRDNNSNASDIVDAELNVTIDKENETAKLNGYFRANGAIYTFTWDGPVNGFIYQEIGDQGITEWDNCYIYSQYGENVRYDTTTLWMRSSIGVDFELFVRNSDNPVEKGLASDTYPVEEPSTRKGVLAGNSRVNGVDIVAGSMDIETDGANYTISFEFTDENGNEYKGTYTGAVPYTGYTHP